MDIAKQHAILMGSRRAEMRHEFEIARRKALEDGNDKIRGSSTSYQ